MNGDSEQDVTAVTSAVVEGMDRPLNQPPLPAQPGPAEAAVRPIAEATASPQPASVAVSSQPSHESVARDAAEAPIVVDGVPNADELLAALRSYLPEGDHEIVRRAYYFAARSHTGQFRKSGEPYFAHPVDVAFLLTRLRLDSASVCAAKRFSPEIAAIVDGVTKLDKIKFASQEHKQAENFRKMLVAMSKDIRVLLIKLADRLHNMTTLQHMKPESQKRIAQETLEIYAPLANRLGIGWLKAQLEDLCFRYLFADEYQKLSDLVGQRQTERQLYVTEVVESLKRIMGEEGLPGALVYGRPKHLYGIWRKMEQSKLPYDQIYDAQGFRVVVEDLKECYQALGAVHIHWKPIPGRFKDYIALPKPNRYQSLHTSIIGPRTERIEVQIRTHEMHRLAEEGVAAHWRYKERGDSISVRDEERFSWLKQLLEWHAGVKDSDEFLDSMKIDLFSDEVYAFTPKGDVKVLPRGSTPVDFAYAIHTKVGEKVTGARVDGVMVPLKHQLRNGNIVEILTRQDAHPSPDWLEFVVTARAKTKIRTYIHAEQRARALDVGMDLLEKALRRMKCSVARAQGLERFSKLISHFKVTSFDDLAVLVGYGKVQAPEAVAFLFPDQKAEEPTEPEVEVRRPRSKSKGAASITVDGIDDVVVRFAKCCSPVPGDAIVGVVTRGRGITVHGRGCHWVLDADPLRRLNCAWNTTAGTGATVTVRVYSANETGLLSAMSARFTEAGIPIQTAHCRVVEGRRAVNDFEVVVSSVGQLNEVIDKLAKLRGVTRVERVRG
jgi:guanosine-3',5'-bis(diphosphate) 3'-pyrophosphohydrolase